ncbi:MAG TPA: carbonic anhydrase [Geothrix sp.]|jgi:carbonic anhydrase
MRVLPILMLATSLALVAEDHVAPSAKAKVPAHGPAPAPAPAAPAGQESAPSSDTPDSPSAALAELSAGNGRFAAGKRIRTIDTGHDAAMRAALTKGQNPFAVILTCSDSRVPDALLFDQEAGRLFTIREAGNAADLQGLASAEYAAEHLGSRLIVVMGHTSCGAVKAVREANGQPLPGNLWALQAGMAGLLESTPQDPNEDARAHTTRLEETNARRQAQAILDRSLLLRDLAVAEKLWVVPALYNLASGRVQFFKPIAVAPALQTHH